MDFIRLTIAYYYRRLSDLTFVSASYSIFAHALFDVTQCLKNSLSGTLNCLGKYADLSVCYRTLFQFLPIGVFFLESRQLEVFFGNTKVMYVHNHKGVV